MKVKIQCFIGSNHSWSICAQNIARSLIKKGHDVDLVSTNGIKHFPDDLRPNLIGYVDDNKQFVGREPDREYDMQISYTAMKNYPIFLSHGSKNRFGIYTFEFAGANNSPALPTGFAKCHQFCDMILSPSTFNTRLFIDSGVPTDKITTIPHGVDFQQLDQAAPYPLKTKKTTKIGILIAQVHRRKNLEGMLTMIGKAFKKTDDVCVVIKVEDRKPSQQFELDFNDIFRRFQQKFPNHCEVEVIRNFIPNIFSFYKSCDIIFYATNCEGFGLISLEALATGCINITSNYSGVVDFCNSDNSLLIDGSVFNVSPNYLYWQSRTGLCAFEPSIDDGVQKLQYAVDNKDVLLARARKNIPYFREHYNWDTITDQIISLTK